MKGLRERINCLYNIGSRDRTIQHAFATRFGEMDKLRGSSLTAPPVLALG